MCTFQLQLLNILLMRCVGDFLLTGIQLLNSAGKNLPFIVRLIHYKALSIIVARKVGN